MNVGKSKVITIKIKYPDFTFVSLTSKKLSKHQGDCTLLAAPQKTNNKISPLDGYITYTMWFKKTNSETPLELHQIYAHENIDSCLLRSQANG